MNVRVAECSLYGDYSKCRPGDCVIAFSKAEIFSIKKEIERLTPYKCAIIYGQLPPETRSLQARLFNEGNLDILVASDAIGMGLNLNIRRTVLHSVLKRGDADSGSTYIHPSAIKQIAGRAGRLSSKFEYGEVTTWQEHDLAYVRAVCDWDIPDIDSAGLFPSVEQVQLFNEMLGDDAGDTKFSYLMDKFTDLSQMDGI
jgi:ATP-dependent RNA helicase SUPV3L1/SUV3